MMKFVSLFLTKAYQSSLLPLSAASVLAVTTLVAIESDSYSKSKSKGNDSNSHHHDCSMSFTNRIVTSYDHCNTTKCDQGPQLQQTVSSASSSKASKSSTAGITTTTPTSSGGTRSKTPAAFSKPGPKILFLGSGSSTGCPKPICSLLFPPSPPKSSSPSSSSHNIPTQLTRLQNEIREDKCKVSKIASIGNPIYNKNYRNNPSILISHSNETSGSQNEYENEIEYKNVIIDVGKTFRESAIRWLPFHSIYNIDAIVLTHEHADAMLGLDDLRGFQKSSHILKPNVMSSSFPTMEHSTRMIQTTTPSLLPSSTSSLLSLPVYLSSKCFDKVKQQFDYLVPNEQKDQHHNNDTNNNNSNCCCNNDEQIVDEQASSSSSLVTQKSTIPEQQPLVKRAVASLDFNIIHYFKPFIAGGLQMIPLPVMHGEDLICNGYAFSIHGNQKNDNENDSNINNNEDKKMTNVVYLSDISRMIPETEEFILNKLPQPTDILIIDSLMMKGIHPVHFSLEQALDLVRRIQPRRTLLVGMNCDAFPEHDEANEMLRNLHPSVQLAHDGLVLEL